MLPFNTLASIICVTVSNAVIIKHNENCLYPENGETVLKECPTNPNFKPDFIFHTETNMISKTKETWPEKKCWTLEKPQQNSTETILKIKFASCEQWGKNPENLVTRKNFIFTENQIKLGIAPGYCVNLATTLPNLVFAEVCDKASCQKSETT
jgi:hypothetical protein